MRATRPSPAALLAAALAVCALAGRARATLSTAGFRAVAVAHAEYPVSSIAVAPDGRLFAAVQAHGQQTDSALPGTAEIRVYQSYATTDGSMLDGGRVWATVDGVRATTGEEGVLGLALAPDFPTSRLVYVYLTTTDEAANQHVRLYRENDAGVGEYAGTVATGLEPPAESPNRNGGGLGFGVDGCLYVGVGDNGSANRWNAQLLVGTDPIRASETSTLCSQVCLGPDLYPARAVANDGAPNQAGKVLRLPVGGAAAVPAPGAPLAAQPFVFAAGLRNPQALGVHPLTGQLYVTERGDTLESEIDVVDAGSNFGWPCLDGTQVAAASSCVAGLPAATVYGNHPTWRPPLLVHTGRPALAGVAAYTGLAYPAEYFGDVFYLLRDGARIYRVDLAPPCFLPDANGRAPLAFHDGADDGDFTVFFDRDGDGSIDEVSFTTFTAIAQGPDPLGRQVLYVVAKDGNSSALTEDSAIFRIEYAASAPPYPGPLGRIADSCFTAGGYENPFTRPACAAVGPCAGLPDGTACGASAPCRAAGRCVAGACIGRQPLPDGSSCAGGDPCGGRAVCQAGVCQPGSGPRALTIGSLGVRPVPHGSEVALSGWFVPTAPLTPAAARPVSLELRDAAGVVFRARLDEPTWRQPRRGLLAERRARSDFTALALRSQPGGVVAVALHARRKPDTPHEVSAARLVIGDECFTADLSGRCTVTPRRLRCHR
ncbi:MAG: PQQ-dependent sugar dehydrogenase [Deltaproteobacteria bacterium]|nr:MAG: PQQ-dependent sugar dehydrogenase [Deltaproteobacteria bacterium]